MPNGDDPRGDDKPASAVAPRPTMQLGEVVRAAAEIERGRTVTARLVEGELKSWAVTYTEVKDVSEREAQSRVDVAVKPIETAMRYSFGIILVLLLALGGWPLLARQLGLDSAVIVAGIIAIAALGAPLGISLNKMLGALAAQRKG